MTDTKERSPLVYKKYNQSTTYLLPLLAKYVNIEFFHQLSNTFIFLEPDYFEQKRKIALLFKTEGIPPDDMFFAYLMLLGENELYINDLEIDDSHRMYVFKFPEGFNDDYDAFLKGEYSKLSNGAKAQIIKFTEAQYKNRWFVEDIVGVLWKKKERKAKLEYSLGMSIPDDVELASICSMDKETIRL